MRDEDRISLTSTCQSDIQKKRHGQIVRSTEMDFFGRKFGEKFGDKVEEKFGKRAGDFAEDTVKMALGCEDKEEEKGGFFSNIFKRDDDDDKDKNKGHDKKKEEEKGGFFSNIFKRDDDDDDKEKKRGFAGLFSEQEGAAGGHGEQTPGGNDGEAFGGMRGQTVCVNDGDLLSDLMDVAEETSKGK